MMKIIKLVPVFVTTIAVLTIMGCVQDDDFTTPDLAVAEPVLDGDIMTIAQLANAYEQAVIAEADDLGINTSNENDMAQLRRNFRLDLSDTNQYVEGFVISSDESGNWFEELIIQDKASDPTAGVRVLIDNSPLFTSFEVGRKIFVKLGGVTLEGQALGGLWVGDSNGVLTLGFSSGLDKIPAPAQFSFIQRSTTVEVIVPRVVTIVDFEDNLENTFIQLDDVQFLKADVIDASLTFAGEPLDEFDGERTLLNCETGQTVILSTSTFASFKSIALPTGRGSISGVLTRDFFGEAYNLAVNDQDALVFDQTERCDPLELDCGIAETTGDNILFEDFFETQATNSLISGNGWTNFQQEGSETWEAYTSSGQNVSLGISARVGAAFSGDASTIAWLITPQIDFASNQGETLQFKTSNSFADGSTLSLLFSSDWDGTEATIATATWDELTAATIVDNDAFFGDWISSGRVDLSCIDGAGYIAFRYNGAGNDNFDGTYELDEIQIKAD